MMVSRRAKIDSTIERRLDEIARLMDIRDYVTVLKEIENTKKEDLSHLSAIKAGRLLLYAAEAFYRTGDYRNGLARANMAVGNFKCSDAHRLYGHAKYIRALLSLELGFVTQAVDDFNESIFAFKRIDDDEGELLASNWAAKCCYMQGRFTHAKEYLIRSLELARDSDIQHRKSGIRCNRGRVLTLLGDFEEAKADFIFDTALAESVPPVNLCNRHISLGYLLVLMREFEDAKGHLEESHSLARENSLSREVAIYHEYAGESAFWQEDHQKAEAHYRQAIQIGMEIAPEGDLISQSYRLLAELQVERDQLDDAEDSCNRAWEVAEKITERLELGAIQRVRGEIAARRGDAETAQVAFDDAIRILSEIGAKYELARTHLQAGEAVIFNGRYRLTNLFAARGLFERVGVIYWQRRTSDQIRQLMRSESATELPKPALAKNKPENGTPFIAVSRPMRKILQQVAKVKDTDMTLLLLGETGVGKDHLAQHIHNISNRAGKPFECVCTVNIPGHLWESELFGHQKGSFTGADADRSGVLERANGGTVYLNEISEIPLDLQAKMLRFLESSVIQRLGDGRKIAIDIRFIAASNRNLREEIAAGRFRPDLYYRLNQMPIILPPLRERRGDVRELARHFLTRYDYSPDRISRLLDSSFHNLIKGANWPGNVRQLEHILRRLVVLADGSDTNEIIEIAREIMVAEDLLPADERQQITALLTANNWNQRRAAGQLGIGESTLRGIMKRLGIVRPVVV